MQKQTVIPNPMRKSIAVLVFILLPAILMFCTPSMAANRVDVQVDGYGIFDTLYTDIESWFEIWIENDFVMGGMHLGFKVWSPDGITWQWINECTIGSNPSFVCPAPGSRADDPNIFDMTGLIIGKNNIDGISPDTFSVGGVAIVNGLPIGPLEHLYSAYFMPLYAGQGLYTLCIDSVFIPPSGAFVFVDPFGSAISPTVMWPPYGRCWPVNSRFCMPTWDESNPEEMTVSLCGSNSAILSASHSYQPVRFELGSLSGGYGTAGVIDNGDGTCEVTYSAVSQDVGQEIYIRVFAACFDGPSWMTWYDLDINVVNNPPVLDPGFYYNWGATNNPIIKDDISAADDDTCDTPEFSIISGPGDIDPVGGVYTWQPGPSDTGTFVVTVEVTDGAASDQDSFEIGVMDEACCAGDANFSGNVNVGDAVMLIAYIFNEGPAPQVPNWADANADCAINVGDVVYLIAYIFNLGPAPQLGCVY